MSAVHRIEDERFVCSATAEDSCRIWPGCECEVWTEEYHGEVHAPGHEPVPQDECWIWQWLTATDLHDSYIDEDWNEAPLAATFPDGPVEWVWDHDYVTWHYADETVPVVPGDEDGD